MWKQFVRDYLSNSKKERTGYAVSVVLIIIFLTVRYYYPLFIPSKKYDYAQFEAEIASLQIEQADSTGGFIKRPYNNNYRKSYAGNQNENDYTTAKGELFYFDPNTTAAADWKRLGVKDKTITTIQKYIAKGGKFYKPEDIGKIWGLRPDQISRLMPYVKIALTAYPAYTKSNSEKLPNDKPVYSPAIIDINLADTSALIALPGIGSKLSQRILNFRDRLGGFYDVNQVGETFGLPDSTFQKIKARLKIVSLATRKININTAELDELKAHPYLRFAISNAIVQYRKQHGNFTSVSDLKKIMLITEDIYNKTAPYLVVN